MNTESEIGALLDQVVKLTRAKDVDGLMRHYTPDVLAFDVIDPLRYAGADVLRQRAAAWFASFDGQIHYDLAELSIAAAEGVAVCHGLSRVVGKTRDGRKLDMWWRTTYGLRKVADSWLIAHVHSSVPFDPSTGAQSGQTTPRAHARAERFNGSARQATEHCSH